MRLKSLMSLALCVARVQGAAQVPAKLHQGGLGGQHPQSIHQSPPHPVLPPLGMVNKEKTREISFLSNPPL